MSSQEPCANEIYHVGALIDERYRLLEFIGIGGMACVYRAQEDGSPHQYAVKFLKAEYHQLPYLIDYFRDEASSMRDLAHPNIVRFYRFVSHETYSYIVMDYVEGFSLSQVMRRMYQENQYIPLDEVVRIMTQTARALDAIHREGYVHRDVKPSNVLIKRQSGQAFLTDLGITSTQNTRIEGAGTVAYMSPEQAETWTADHRADIYSYGVLYFELLAMRRPFHVDQGLSGDDAEANLLEKHKNDPVPNITDFRPDLPEALNDILSRALAKAPADRYQNILELAKDIHAALAPQLSMDLQDFTSIVHRQISEPDSEAIMQENKEQPLMRFIPLMIGALMGVLMLVLVFFLLQAVDEPPATETQPVAPPTAGLLDVLEGQQIYPLVAGMDALAETYGSETLRITPENGETLHYLRIGRVNGFQADVEITSNEGVSAFGLAFRMQDAANYLLFRIDPATNRWQFSEVVNGNPNIIQDGEWISGTSGFTLAGLDDYFQVQAGDTILIFTSSLYESGSLALYIESGTLELASLQISLVGAEAESAAANPPTPAPGIADPRRFLRADVAALLATNDVLNSEINCPAYIAIYETLERHETSRSAEVRRLAQETITSAEIIYTRCRSESP
ncbi:MAG: serine/threonine protein kinase, partial [Anaerolineae bacterium]|nr:serine/threonine protein kinase [Anaerolineae bacterium]